MEKKDFYEYAGSFDNNIVKYNPDITKLREDKLRAASARTIEITNYITDNFAYVLENSSFKMQFQVCLNEKFYKYNWNWADIFLNYGGKYVFIFICDSEMDYDIISQLWSGENKIIINNNDMDFSEKWIIDKISAIL